MPEKLSTLSGAKKLYDNLNQKIKTEVTEREQALTDTNLSLEQEVQARKNADNTLQKNIDKETANREEALLEEAQQRTLDIQTEANSRLNADSELSNKLNEEIENHAFDVNQLQGQIGNETNARLAADATLSKQINQEILDRKSAITTEQRERQNNDASLKTLIENEGKVRAAQDNALATNLNTETEARIKADSDEQSARISSDEALKQLIEKEVDDRKAAVSSEAKARESIDNSLNQKILNETSARVAQDQVLNQSIEQNRSEINTALSQEASTRSAADTAILQQLTQERELRTSADTTLQQNIDKEADTRYIEDNRLQSSITSIESKIPAQASDSNQLADKAFVNSSISTMASFFKGTFKTYAALMEVRWQTTDPEGSNYVHNGDYAYVESDETHNGESWRYIYVLDPDSEDNGWQAQLKMNDTPFTQAQLDSINSGITQNAVNQITVNTNNISSVSTRLTTHAEDQNNPHFVTKEQVGLGNVDNTSDADKPVSKATEAAINVNTLRINEHIADKNNPHNVTLKQLGIDSFAGYTPQTMPVSAAQEAAITAVGDVLQAHINIDTNPNPHQITKAKVGLGNVDNTSDKDKPVSDAVKAALDKKANTESPNFTGIPIAPLPDETSPDNQLATVKYVKDNAGTSGAVSFSIQQDLTDSQQQTARDNINAAANYRTNIQTGSGIVTLANSLPLDLHDKYYGSFAQVGTPSLSKFSPITFVQGSIRVNNKNILPKGQSTVINGVTFTVRDDGTTVLSGTAEDQITYIIYQKYLPKTQYVISGCPDNGSATKYALHLSLYKGSTRITSADCYNSTTGGVIDTSTYDYDNCRVEITVQKDVVCNELTFKPQLERGSIFSLYQSYEERNNIVISEDSSLKALPLGSSIPDNIVSSDSLFDGVYDLGTDSNHSYYVADTIENSKEVLYDQKKVIVYRIQEKVFTGNETIIYNNVTTGKERFQYVPESDKLPLVGNSLVLVMSNAFQSASFNDLTDSVKRKNNSVCIEDGISNDYISFYSSDYTDVASFKETLKTLYDGGTPVKVYYIRQTPITEVADSVEYSAYKGTTQIVCDCVVEPYIKAGYKENVWDLLTQQGEVSQQVVNAVTYDEQTATEAQKKQARENIGAVDATYVSAQGGKIDTIKVNGVTQTITDKSVNLEVVTSVNSKSGNVTLNASDVNALPSSTTYVSTVDGSSGAITTNAVKYNSQTLTDAQKTQARDNIGAQQKLYNLTLDTPIVENQTINPNSTYTFSSPITLNEYDMYWIDVQRVYKGQVQNRYQLLSRAINGDSGITVQWMGYIILDATGVTLEISGDDTYIITIAKVLDYERPVDSAIAHQEGEWCIASCTTAHVEGANTVAFGECSHAEGQGTNASSDGSHSEGISTTASGMSSHAEGQDTNASSDGSHSEGIRTTASGTSSHAEGYLTTASGNYSHAEGCGSNTLPDTVTSASTNDDIITAYNGIGGFSLAKGYASHVEGADNLALGDISHAEGLKTTASGDHSHAEGWDVIASGTGSHAEGYGTKASSGFQHVQGRRNIEDSYNNYAHIVGNGNDDSVRSNAHTLDWSGNAWFAGDVYVGSTSGTHKDAGSKKLAKESTTVSATLSASLWSGSSVPYTYTLSISGVTTTSNQELLPALNITEEQLTALQSANIQDGGQLSESIVLKAFGDKPTVDIPIRVILRGDA